MSNVQAAVESLAAAEDELSSDPDEARAQAKEAVETLTPTLRSALDLGDTPGLDTAQRVRLSRARTRVRRALAAA